MRNLRHRNYGFTLIEVILSLVVAGVLAAMIFSYFGTSIIRSSTPVVLLQNALSLQQVMENMTMDYKANFTGNLAGLRTKIGTVSTIPKSNSYGNYEVVSNGYIKFVGGTENTTSPVPEDILKVVIKNAQGDRQTILFVKQ